MPPVRRPLFILPDLAAGGAERVVLALAEHLVARDAAPTLFLIRRRGEWLERVPAGVKRVCALDGDARVARHGFAVVRALLACARGCDVIVGALEHESAYLAWLGGGWLRRPAIGWIHAMMGEHLPELSPWHTRLARQVYPRLDRLVFPTQIAVDSLASIAPLRHERVSVIPSSIDVARVRERATEPLPPWAAEAFRAPVVVSVGRLVPSKDHATLIEAHALARCAGVDHRVVILGDGPLRDDLRRLAEARRVQDTVLMPGYAANPHAIVKASAVFALPSRFECQSLALLEALAVGVPVIATEGPGGQFDVLEGGRYGLLVPPGDPAALARAMTGLLRDASMRRSFGATGPERAREFDAANTHPLWDALLDAMA